MNAHTLLLDAAERCCSAIEDDIDRDVAVLRAKALRDMIAVAISESPVTSSTTTLRIWHCAIDGKGGTISHAALTEREIEEWLLADLDKTYAEFEEWLKGQPIGDNIFDFLSEHADELTTYNMECTDIELPATLPARVVDVLVSDGAADDDEITEDTIGYLVRDALVLLDRIDGAEVSERAPCLVKFTTEDGTTWRAAISKEV